MLGAARAPAEAARGCAATWLTAVVGHEETEAEKDGPKALIADINSRAPGLRPHPDRGRARRALGDEHRLAGLHDHPDRAERRAAHPLHPLRGEPDPPHGRTDRAHRRLPADLDATTRHPLAGAGADRPRHRRGGRLLQPHAARRPAGRHPPLGPGRTPTQVLEELRRLVAPVAEAGGCEATVRMEHEREPFDTPTDDPAVLAAARAHE